MSRKLVALIASGGISNELIGPLDTVNTQHNKNGPANYVGLSLFPDRVLTFNVSPLALSSEGGVDGAPASVSCTISVENSLEERIYFRFKTNRHTRYVLTPTEGILRPKSVTTVFVTVDQTYVKYLLNSGYTGVLRCEDAILMTLVKLKHRFCQMYDCLVSEEDKVTVVGEVGKSLRTVRANGKVATWHKWLCTYVVSQLAPSVGSELPTAQHATGAVASIGPSGTSRPTTGHRTGEKSALTFKRLGQKMPRASHGATMIMRRDSSESKSSLLSGIYSSGGDSANSSSPRQPHSSDGDRYRDHDRQHGETKKERQSGTTLSLLEEVRVVDRSRVNLACVPLVWLLHCFCC